MLKFIVLLIIITSNLSLSAQNIKTTYHLKDGSIVSELKDSYYYRNIAKSYTVNNIDINAIEEYYTENNTPKRIGLTTSEFPPFKFFKIKQEFYAEGTIKSQEKFHISGKMIDTAYYWYPDNKIKLITYIAPKDINISKIKYLAYLDSQQNMVIQNGSGYVRNDLSGISSESTEIDYEEGNVINHEKNGLWKGKLYGEYEFEEIYENGNLVKGKTINSTGKTTTYTGQSLNEQASYKGGFNSLISYIENNYQIPLQAKQAGIKGTLNLYFVVDKDGNISDISVIKDLGYGTKDAAIEVVKKLQKFEPAKYKGIPQKSIFSLPININ